MYTYIVLSKQTNKQTLSFYHKPLKTKTTINFNANHTQKGYIREGKSSWNLSPKRMLTKKPNTLYSTSIYSLRITSRLHAQNYFNSTIYNI